MTPTLHFLSFVTLAGNKLRVRGHCNSSQSYDYKGNSHKAAEVKLRKVKSNLVEWHSTGLSCVFAYTSFVFVIFVSLCVCMHPWIGVHRNTRANSNTHTGV